MNQHRDEEEDEMKEEETEVQAGGDLGQVFAQLRRIMDHLGYLERKIDQLLANGQGGQGSGRPHFRKDFGGRPPRREFGGGGQGRGGFRGGNDRPFFNKDRDRGDRGDRGERGGNREGGHEGGAPRHWKREPRGRRSH